MTKNKEMVLYYRCKVCSGEWTRKFIGTTPTGMFMHHNCPVIATTKLLSVPPDLAQGHVRGIGELIAIAYVDEQEAKLEEYLDSDDVIAFQKPKE